MANRQRATGVPAELFRTGNRVLRPGAFKDVYSNPRLQFARLAQAGVLERVAHGYYLIVPEERRPTHWRPEIEAVGLGIAVADYGRDMVTLIGPAAARRLNAIPRALAVATVAIPKQRPLLGTHYGSVWFVKRDVDRLDRQRVETELVTGWTTTAEQTALDLADRPTLGEITPVTAAEAIRTLARQADPVEIERLAKAQRKRGAWQRLCWVAGLPVPADLRYGIATHGLDNPKRHPSEYGLVKRAA